MKSILLIGLGRFGSHVAKKFAELRHEVMAIDINEERVNSVLPFVTDAKIGDSTNYDFMASLGVRNFDVCIVAIGDDFQSSLITTSLIKEFGAPLVVSRAASDVHAKFLLKNGADQIVYPEQQLANWVAITYSSELIFDYIPLGEGYSIFEISVPKSWVGKSIVNLGVRQKYNINIMAVKYKDRIDMEITANTVLTDNMNLLVICKDKDLHKVIKF